MELKIQYIIDQIMLSLNMYMDLDVNEMVMRYVLYQNINVIKSNRQNVRVWIRTEMNICACKSVRLLRFI